MFRLYFLTGVTVLTVLTGLTGCASGERRVTTGTNAWGETVTLQLPPVIYAEDAP